MKTFIFIIIYVVIPLIARALNKSSFSGNELGNKPGENRSNWQCCDCHKSNRYYMTRCSCGNTKNENESFQMQNEQLDLYCKKGYSDKDENGEKVVYKSNDYRFWEKILHKKTSNFTASIKNSKYPRKCINRIKTYAPEEKFNEINGEYCEYIKSISEELVEKKINQKRTFISCCENDEKKITEQIQSLDFSDRLCVKNKKFAKIIIIVFAVISVVLALLAVTAFIIKNLMVHLKLIDLFKNIGGTMVFFTIASIALLIWFIYDRKSTDEAADAVTERNSKHRDELNAEIEHIKDQIREATNYIHTDKKVLIEKIYEEYTGQEDTL